MEEQEDIIKLLAKNIKEIRKQRFKTQELFAKHIGMTYSKYARFEKSGQISFDGFVEIVKGLNKLDEFVELFKSSSLFAQELSAEIIEEKTKVITTHVPTKEVTIKEDVDEYNADIKRVVIIFDQERRKLQSNFVRKEYKNVDGQYLLRMHMKETQRTPKMFFDAIRWLFSNNPKASFHRQYIMNIGKLIEHFNTLEHQAMYSQEAVAFNDETRAWYNVYKKQGLLEEEIMQILKDCGYIK
ncbi:MAG: helix-turn-helix transcriptional regulator [Sulfurimonas sp.]